MKLSKKFSFLAMTGLIAMACTKDDNRPEIVGPEIEEPESPKRISGTLYLESGKPAAGAVVRVYSVDHVPGPAAAKRSGMQELAYSTRTDSAGRYEIDSLERGEYNILGEREGLSSFRASVYLSGTPLPIDPDTLLDAGMLTGFVGIQPNHSQQTLIIQAMGTNVYANADLHGRFTLGPLPAGRHRIRISTTESQYTALFTSLTVRRARHDTLADTLRPVYTGIPVVTGLTVSYDTLAGMVRLSWNRADYPQTQGYKVLRNRARDFSQAPTLLDLVEDTTYVDALFAPDSLSGRGTSSAGFPDSAVFEYQYRVKLVNKSDQEGLSYGFASIKAPSPYWVRTVIDFDGLNRSLGREIRDNEVSVGDSLRINAWFNNPTRRIKRVEWFRYSEDNKPLHVVDLDPPVREGVTALIVAAGKEPGTETFLVKAWDEAGYAWRGRWGVNTVADAPIVNAGRDTTIPKGGTVHLRGMATDRYGSIGKWEWDIGATGTFIPVSRGDTAFPLPDSVLELPCILRVADDDGQIERDTVVIRYGLKWSKESPAFGEGSPRDFFHSQMIEFKGKLWILGGRQLSSPRTAPRQGIILVSGNGVDWDTVSTPNPFPSIVGQGAVVFKDKIWIIGGRIDMHPELPNIEYFKYNQEVWSSEDGRNWHQVTATGFPGSDQLTLAAFQGKLWAIGGFVNSPGSQAPEPNGVMHSVDGETWTQVHSNNPLPPLAGHASVVFQGKIWVMGGYDYKLKRNVPDVWFSLDGLDWEQATPNAGFRPRSGAGLYAHENRMWLIGGYERAPVFSEEKDIRPLLPDVWTSADGATWRQMAGSEVPNPRAGFAGGVFGGKIWMMSGVNDTQGYLRDVWMAR